MVVVVEVYDSSFSLFDLKKLLTILKVVPHSIATTTIFVTTGIRNWLNTKHHIHKSTNVIDKSTLKILYIKIFFKYFLGL